MIIVVEDDNAVRVLTEDALQVRGYHVISARDGAEAFDRIRREPRLSLVVTDIRMPGIDGWELARRVAAIRPDIKVLYITGYTAEQMPEDAPRGPLLRKPWKLGEFYTCIEQLVPSDEPRRSDP